MPFHNFFFPFPEQFYFEWDKQAKEDPKFLATYTDNDKNCEGNRHFTDITFNKTLSAPLKEQRKEAKALSECKYSNNSSICFYMALYQSPTAKDMEYSENIGYSRGL